MLNRVINADLHIHSHASAYKDKDIVSESTIENLDVLFDKLQQHNISLFAFTDHNRFDSELFKAARRIISSGKHPAVEGIVAGIEFDVKFDKDKPTAHIITLFDTEDDDANLDAIADVISENLLTDPKVGYSEDQFESILRKIGLRTMLIAHQHEGLSVTPKKKHSIGTATSSAKEMLYFGYIDAVEYNNSRVQGILKNDLYELDIPVSAVVGSDCHDWSEYPAHDASQQAKSPFCTRIKCLPTFQGLLMAFTSPETRFQVPKSPFKNSYIRNFEIDGKTIDLSTGINAIIGENGAGKSSLFELLYNPGNNRTWVTSFKTKNKIVTNQLPDAGRVKGVHQGDLRDRFNKNSLIDPSNYEKVDNEPFEKQIDNYSSTLLSILKDNVARKLNGDTLMCVSFSLQPELETQTYDINITIPENFAKNDNPHKSRLTNLRKIAASIDEEIDTGYYSETDTKILKNALSSIQKVVKHVEEASNYEDAVISAKNTISLLIEEYQAEISKHKTDRDADITEYRKDRDAFISSIVAVASDIARKQREFPVITIGKEDGVSRKPANGFLFIKTAKYRTKLNLEEELWKDLFNNRYRSKKAILELDTIESIASAVKGANIENWETIWSENINKFITNCEKTESSIHDQRSNKALGNTLGEQSLTYYKYETYNGQDWDVIFIDQPEDDISHSRIHENLIDYFNSIRVSHQIIMVTHNPLLVVNQDVDNVIVINQKEGKAAISSGCLESAGILDEVAEHMDGGRRAIKQRLNVYGPDKGDN